ncbi:MAG: hypothetical protein JO129_04060 [Candidatus Dependentiae bacterium]|nr:hypothetical protein [Candidatus Dependentiae bacterium]
MKNMNVLSLFILLSSAQIYSTYANPQLLFVFAAQAANILDETAVSDTEDSVAVGIINTMNSCISLDQNLQAQLKSAQGGMLYGGTPINVAAIKKANQQLENAINGYNSNLKKLRGAGGTAATANRAKINAETKHRNEKQKQLATNQAVLQANTTAQGKIASLNTTVQQNMLAFEQALETYIATFGQCYIKSGSVYGSTTIISSKDNIGEPITPKEYAQLIKTLQAAATQFGSNVTVTLAINGGSTATANISNVISYMNNMSPSSASYLTYAAYGLGAVAATAALIAGANAAYNYSQGQSLTDTTAVQNALAGAGESLQTFTATQQQNLTEWYNALPSAQQIPFINWFTSLTPAQQAAELSSSASAPATPMGTDYSSYFNA